MLSRKQQWRRVKSPRRGPRSFPSEIIKLADEQKALTKSSSWQPNALIPELENQNDSNNLKTTAMTRSVSCSSLTSKRSLFRKNDDLKHLNGGQKDEKNIKSNLVVRRTGSEFKDLLEKIEYKSIVAAKRGDRLAGWQRRKYEALQNGQFSVEFDPRVAVKLIPSRSEIEEFDKGELWWSREDYAQFRQVLIDWKTINGHKLQASDNILSINLSELDTDDESDQGSCSPDVPLQVTSTFQNTISLPVPDSNDTWEFDSIPEANSPWKEFENTTREFDAGRAVSWPAHRLQPVDMVGVHPSFISNAADSPNSFSFGLQPSEYGYSAPPGIIRHRSFSGQPSSEYACMDPNLGCFGPQNLNPTPVITSLALRARDSVQDFRKLAASDT